MTIEILDSNQSIAQKIKLAINRQVYDEILYRKINILISQLQEFIYNKFLTSYTYASLAGGILRAEFGLSDEEVSKLPSVIKEIVNVDGLYVKTGNTVKILINICDKKIDFDSVGMYSYTDKDGEIILIHWLYWLLTQGDGVITPEYSIWLKPGAGRSEMAFMFEPKEGGSYSVDGEFSGTEVDNWVTRTLRDNKSEIINIINRVMNNNG